MFALLKNHKLILHFTENENPFSFGKIILIIKKQIHTFMLKIINVLFFLIHFYQIKNQISSFKILQELRRNIFF